MRVNSTNKTQCKDSRLHLHLHCEGSLSWRRKVPGISSGSFGHLTHPTNERRLNQYFRLCVRSASHCAHPTNTLIGSPLEALPLIGQGGPGYAAAT